MKKHVFYLASLLALVMSGCNISIGGKTSSVSENTSASQSVVSSKEESSSEEIHSVFDGEITLNKDNPFTKDGDLLKYSDGNLTLKIEGGDLLDGGWFSLDHGGYLTNTAPFGYFTGIEVEYESTASYGFVVSRASSYPITSPGVGAYPLMSGTQFDFPAGNGPLKYFSVCASVGTFNISSITLHLSSTTYEEEIDDTFIDIFAVNDTHGATTQDSSNKYPGLAKLGGYLRANGNANPDNTIFISSGDMWQGSADSNLTKGYVMTDWMNAVGYEFMTIGNHEFDWHEEGILENLDRANFPFLGINIRYPDGTTPEWAKPSVVIERAGHKIGFIGAIGPIESSIAASCLNGMYFARNHLELIKNEATRLREEEGCEVVCVSIHYDSLDTSVVDNVDVVFEGHTHRSYADKDSNGVLHIQAAAYGKFASRVTFRENSEGKLVLTAYSNTGYYDLVAEGDDAMSVGILEHYNGIIGKIKEEVVGYTETTIYRNDIAKSCAELMFNKYRNEEYSTDLIGAVVNTGCARQNIAPGQITYGDVYASLPFDNDNVLYTCDSTTIRSLATNSTLTSHWVEGFDEYNLDPEKTYYVMVISYVGEGSSYGDYLTEITRDPINRLRDLYADMLRETTLNEA
ncbi:MAG: hypothetical protein K5694_06950 [Bacilli bacterium]|nr:hypothetical protein [Bacilli bacterium]